MELELNVNYDTSQPIVSLTNLRRRAKAFIEKFPETESAVNDLIQIAEEEVDYGKDEYMECIMAWESIEQLLEEE